MTGMFADGGSGGEWIRGGRPGGGVGGGGRGLGGSTGGGLGARAMGVVIGSAVAATMPTDGAVVEGVGEATAAGWAERALVGARMVTGAVWKDWMAAVCVAAVGTGLVASGRVGAVAVVGQVLGLEARGASVCAPAGCWVVGTAALAQLSRAALATAAGGVAAGQQSPMPA